MSSARQIMDRRTMRLARRADQLMENQMTVTQMKGVLLHYLQVVGRDFLKFSTVLGSVAGNLLGASQVVPEPYRRYLLVTSLVSAVLTAFLMDSPFKKEG